MASERRDAVVPRKHALECPRPIRNASDRGLAGSFAGSRSPARPAGEWLESPDTGQLIQRVARQYGLGGNEFPDLLQETRIALWKAGLKTRVTAGWLVRTAAHKAVDAVRVDIRRRAREDRTARGMRSQPPADSELEHLLHARVEALPSRLREFYELHYRLGFSEREIGQALGLCRSSVRWLDRCCRRSIGVRGAPPV